MSEYILSIDQGTTSSRAMIFDSDGAVVSSAQQEFRQYFPRDGWVEHDGEEIWQSVLQVCRKALAESSLAAGQIKGIGITNQRETTLIWDRNTGKPIHPAIVWQDRRTSDYCSMLKAQQYEPMVQARTGLLIDPYFSATKIKWLLDHVDQAHKKARAGELAFGTVDTWLLWCLTDGASHKTDATNASRTLLYNIHEQCWDQELLKLFEVPASLLPEVEDCTADFGTSRADLLGEPVPIAGMAGDQQAALIGQACFEPGMIKSTYGTGCFMVLNTGDQPLVSHNKLLTTIAYRIKGKTTYALEGSIFVAGATVQWLRDGLEFIAHAKETEAMAETVGAQQSVYLVPAFTGLGAPFWDPHARGAIFGLTRDTGIAAIVTAGLQSVAYQSRDLIRAMISDGASSPKALRVDGGMVANNWIVQFLSDILNVCVERPRVIETTALGVAYLAGLQTGVYESLEEIAALWCCEKQVSPHMKAELREHLYAGWCDAVERVRIK